MRDDDAIDALRKVWSLSMHDDCPIWLAGAMQHIVTEALDGQSNEDVEHKLGNEVVALTPGEVDAIRERNQRIRRGEYYVL